MTLANGGSPIFPLVVHSKLLRPSGQQCSHSSGVFHISRGAYVGAGEMMCVLCVSVTEGT